MGLKAFKRDTEAVKNGVWVSINGDMDVLIKEWGTPEFWACYMDNVIFTGSSILRQHDIEATTIAIAETIVMALRDPDTKELIDKPEDVKKIIENQDYWELKAGIITESKRSEQFKASQKNTAKKP